MKTPTNATTVGTNKRLIAIVAVVAVAAVTLIVVALNTKNLTTNYAEEIANPLERGLTAAGGIKKCAVGSSGRTELSGSNRTPWYQVYFELPQNREEAKAIVVRIAADNGYDLTQATPQKRGSVPAADPYLDDWLYNTSEKKSPYTDLETGDVTLFTQVINTPNTYTCNNGDSVKIDAGEGVSTVRWDVRLPSFKR